MEIRLPRIKKQGKISIQDFFEIIQKFEEGNKNIYLNYERDNSKISGRFFKCVKHNATLDFCGLIDKLRKYPIFYEKMVQEKIDHYFGLSIEETTFQKIKIRIPKLSLESINYNTREARKKKRNQDNE